jgi:tripartite-type tricarboxylate transporter receptor subunit TctC
VRALAVTAPARLRALPNVPTVAEFVPGYEATGFFGIVAPKKTPREIVERINGAMNAALDEPNLSERLAELGAVVSVGSSLEFGKLIVGETEKWSKVVNFSGAKAE